MSARENRTRLAGTLAATIAIALALGVSSASAELVHPLLFSFDGSATPAGSFIPEALSVDSSSGDVYVSDEDAPVHVIDKFSAAGSYLCQITGAGSATTSASECDPSGPETPTGPFGKADGQSAVDSSGDLYVPESENHVVDEFGPAGAYLSQIQIPNQGLPQAVSIDTLGDVLIAEFGGVEKFDPSTSTLSPFTSSSLILPYGVAVDGDPSSSAYGDVYVADLAKKQVDVFNSAGVFQTQLTGTPGGSFSSVYRVAVDQSSGDLYVVAGNAIDEFSPAGVFMTQIRIANGGVPRSVAIDPKTGDVYVGLTSNGTVEVFGPGVIAPNVATEPATGVQPTGATLSGHVEPAGGEVVSCRFEYGTSTSYGQSMPCSPSTPYTSVTAVSAAVAELAPDTTYHFRLVAANASATNYSEDGEFTTTGPPTISEESATDVTHTTATLKSQIDPHGFETTYHFEYGTTTGYGTSIPAAAEAAAGSGLANQEVSQEISGLAPGATYHYRVVATNSQGTVDGPDQELTAEAVATIENQSWIAGPQSATLKAKIDTFGENSTCQVQYVGETEFSSSGYAHAKALACTPEELGGAGGEQFALARLAGLAVDSIYHFRFVVTNAYGELAGPDQAFATFGVQALSFGVLNENGEPYTQAGGHPYELTTSIALNMTTDNTDTVTTPSGNLKDVSVQLPPGLIGNPQATPRCTRYNSERFACSGDSQVGRMTVETAGGESLVRPLFNLVPPFGVAAEFGARFNDFVNGFIEAKVRTGGDYGISAGSLNITTLESITGVKVTMWGVPAAASHEDQRNCPAFKEGGTAYSELPCPSTAPLKPFLTNPTSCSGPLTTRALVDSYQQPGEFVEAHTETPGMTGCERLHFSPSITVKPESSSADSPTGLEVHLHVPQEENADGLAEADLKDAVVTLPRGVTINPADADGTVACTPAQIEIDGPEPATCPAAAKIGSAEIDTPLIEHPLEGAVYLAQQGNAGAARGANPFGSLLAIYVAIDDPETGVVIKLAGRVTANPETGQLTTSFDENPQLPFEDLKLDFFGGPRAALATPQACGAYTTTTSLAPWSGQSAAEPSSPFQITSGAGGGACPSGPQPFAPSFAAGTTNNQAGAFSPFTLTLTRADQEQAFGSVATQMPPGLAGILSKVALCGEAQANAGSCTSASQIGHVTVQVGVGDEPITLPEAGKQEDPVYLTGPYGGAPFGLAIVVHPEAGPFNLEEGGHPVIVRGAIDVDPKTAQVSIESNPMPTILQGIPLDVKTIDVTIDRPEFTFNPTNCTATTVGATIASAAGASAGVSSRFQAANCATLPFKPVLSAATAGQASKADGASLEVKVTSKGGPQTGGGEANIKSVKVDLPQQLSSRLTTLQKACTEAQFGANPAGCPAASNVGSATATTPILAHPLTGPAYLVSHGGAAFPDLEVVLQGEGITLILDGNTNIKNGITSSTFKAVPDTPVSAFELKLPTGPYSILGANVPASAHYDLCGQTLAMPTAITGQNGAEIHESTPISVSGCKPAISVVGHSVKGKTATIAVSVPAAGRLVASSKDLSRALGKAKQAGTVTVKLTLSKGERAFLAKHKGRKLKAKIKLQFTPTKGSKLSTSVTVLIG